MKVSENIAFTIDRLPKGYIFTYSDFKTEVTQKEAVIKALNRMVASGKIAKLSKGKYYKPENTPFGNLQPNQAQVLKDLLEENLMILQSKTIERICPSKSSSTPVVMLGFRSKEKITLLLKLEPLFS